MAVITISRQYGSGGNEIAELIGKTTGYRIFDKQVIAEAAIEVGFTDRELIDYSENDFKVKSFLGRLFSSQQHVAQVRTSRETGGKPVVDELSLTEEHAVALVRKAIEYAHERGNIVIVGRGGQVVLADRPDVLHVRIMAPAEDRLLRVRSFPAMANQTFADSVEVRRAAQDLMAAKDAASSGYLKQFYGVDWNDPALYHLMINTGKLHPIQAAYTIIDAARRLEPMPDQPQS